MPPAPIFSAVLPFCAFMYALKFSSYFSAKHATCTGWDRKRTDNLLKPTTYLDGTHAASQPGMLCLPLPLLQAGHGWHGPTGQFNCLLPTCLLLLPVCDLLPPFALLPWDRWFLHCVLPVGRDERFVVCMPTYLCKSLPSSLLCSVCFCALKFQTFLPARHHFLPSYPFSPPTMTLLAETWTGWAPGMDYYYSPLPCPMPCNTTIPLLNPAYLPASPPNLPSP